MGLKPRVGSNPTSSVLSLSSSFLREIANDLLHPLDHPPLPSSLFCPDGRRNSKNSDFPNG